jgi:hypothetical protein
VLVVVGIVSIFKGDPLTILTLPEHAGLPPPLGHPRIAIMMYHLYKKLRISVNLKRVIAMRPFPHKETDGAKRGIQFT